MKSIEITTTQNVTIAYGLASAVQRSVAYFIDAVLITAVSSLMYWLGSFVIPDATTIIEVVFWLPVVLFYTPAFEIFNNGQSPGKMALRIRVVRMDGREAGVPEYIMRWSFRMLEIYASLGSLAVLVISATPYRQRIGDMLAGTVVVQVGTEGRMRLEDLMQLSKLETYSPAYPEAARMSEDDMLLVKEMIGRFSRYPNAAHRLALERLTDRIREELGVEPKEGRLDFLRVLLRDYIALSR